jgi:hypothetical protein
MEVACTSETSVDIQLITMQYIPEDSELHTRRRENLKSHRSHLHVPVPLTAGEDPLQRRPRRILVTITVHLLIATGTPAAQPVVTALTEQSRLIIT